MRAAIALATAHGLEVAIPAGVLAQAWRDGRRQARLSVLISDRRVRIEEVDGRLAMAAGVLCGRAGTSDVVDASVVLCARRQRNAVVLTSDADDLVRLDPGVRVVTV